MRNGAPTISPKMAASIVDAAAAVLKSRGATKKDAYRTLAAAFLGYLTIDPDTFTATDDPEAIEVLAHITGWAAGHEGASIMDLERDTNTQPNPPPAPGTSDHAQALRDLLGES